MSRYSTTMRRLMKGRPTPLAPFVRTLSAKGQISLSKRLLDAYGAKRGDQVVFEPVPGGFGMRFVRRGAPAEGSDR